MSVVNEFDCKSIQVYQNSTLYMVGLDDQRWKFSYNVDCVAELEFKKIKFFFNTDHGKCLIIFNDNGMYQCVMMKFSIQNDKPTLSAKHFVGQDTMIDMILPQFKEKYASILIDKAINE